MAWCQPGDKPLSEQMMVSLLTHMCVTRLRWVNQMFCFIGNAVLIIYDNTYIVYAAYVNYFYKSDFNYSFSRYLLKRNGSWYSMARFLWNPLSADIFQAWLHGSWVPASVLQWAETCNAINHYTKNQTMRGEKLWIINRWSDGNQWYYQICAHILCVKEQTLEEKLLLRDTFAVLRLIE